MTMIPKIQKPLTVRFIEEGPAVQLELTNSTEQTLEFVEIVTVFLKDEETAGGGPSRAHVSFNPIEQIHPKASAVLTHKTWIDGKPVDAARDQLGRLKVVEGKVKPYVLHISWRDTQGKSRFQAIAVGH